jgi:predicted phosphodiesterase
MRVALISDLHANELALDAVRRDIDRVGVDQVICLGDVATLGPRPNAVIQGLRDMGCPCIVGNHDAFLVDPELIHSYTEAPIVVEAVDWCRDQLSSAELDFLRGFLPTLEIDLGSAAKLFLFHGSPASHMDDLLATTPEADLDRFLGGHQAQIMAGGHTHVQMLRQHRGTLLVNPGSLGQPFKEYVAGRTPTLLPHAEYATVEAVNGAISVTLRRVGLEKDALRRAAHSSDNPLSPFLVEQYS